jgi:fibronectin type III domain protein
MARRCFGLRAFVCAVCLVVLPRAVEAATVTLQWDPNTESDLRGYVLQWGTATRVYTQTVDVGNTTTHTLTLNTPGSQTYFFTVVAYSDAGVSTPSAEVSTVVTNPITQPRLAIDIPRASQVVSSDFLVSGWAADLGATASAGIDGVHVYAYPNPGSGTPAIFLGVASFGTGRGDVAAAFGAQFMNSGYSLPVVGLPPGTYDLVMYAHSTVANAFNVAQSVRIRVFSPAAPPPLSGTVLTVDGPAQNATIAGALTIAGWALDLRSTTGTGVGRVDLWAYPSPGSGKMPLFLGTAQSGLPRSDVGAAFGSTRFTPSGFAGTVTNLSAGTYDIVAMALSTVSGGYDAVRVRRVTVQSAVLVAVDTPRPGAIEPSSFAIGGWALDLHSSIGSGIDAVHVWAYRNPGSGTPPVFAGSATMNVARPDVAAVFGARYAMAGYFLAVSGLAPGDYDLLLYPHNSTTGAFEGPTSVRIKVQ